MCDECFDIDSVDHLKADERYKTSMVLVKSGIGEPLDYFTVAVVEYHSGSIRSAQTYLRNWIDTGLDTAIARLFYCQTLSKDPKNNSRRLELLRPVLFMEDEHPDLMASVFDHVLPGLIEAEDFEGLQQIETHIISEFFNHPLAPIAKFMIDYSRGVTLKQSCVAMVEPFSDTPPNQYYQNPELQTALLIAEWIVQGASILTDDRDIYGSHNPMPVGDTIKKVIEKGTFCGVEIPEPEIAVLMFSNRFPTLQSEADYEKIESRLLSIELSEPYLWNGLFFAIQKSKGLDLWVTRLIEAIEESGENGDLTRKSIYTQLHKSPVFLKNLVKAIATRPALEPLLEYFLPLKDRVRDLGHKLELPSEIKRDFNLELYKKTNDWDALFQAAYHEPGYRDSIALYEKAKELARTQSGLDVCTFNQLICANSLDDFDLVIKLYDQIINEEYKEQLKPTFDNALLKIKENKGVEQFFRAQPSVEELEAPSYITYIVGRMIIDRAKHLREDFDFIDFWDYSGSKALGKNIVEILLTHRVLRPANPNAVKIDSSSGDVTIVNERTDLILNIKEYADKAIPFTSIGDLLVTDYMEEVTTLSPECYLDDMCPIIEYDYRAYLEDICGQFKVPLEKGSKLDITINVLANHLISEHAYRIMYNKAQDAGGNIRSGKPVQHAVNGMLYQIRMNVFKAIEQDWEIYPMLRDEYSSESSGLMNQIDRDIKTLNARSLARSEISLKGFELKQS